MKQDSFEDLTKPLDTTLVSRRQLLSGLAASAALVAFPILELGRSRLAYAQSDSQIAPSPLETAEGLTKAAWLNHLSKLSPVERAREVQWTVNMMMASDAAGGSLSSFEFAQRSQDNLASFDSSVMRGETLETLEKMSMQDSILAVLQSISVGAGGSVSVSLSPGPLYQEFFYKGAKEDLDTQNQVTAVQAQLEAVEQWNGLVDNIANKLIEKSRIDPVLRAGIESKTSVDFALKNTYDVLADQGADFQVLDLVRNAIGPDGALTISLYNLQEASRREFDTLKGMMADQMTVLKTIDARQRSFMAWSLTSAQAEQYRREAEAAAQQKAQEAQIILDGAKSTVSLLSTLIGLADKDAAKKVSVTLNSAIQVGDSINKFMQSVSTFGKVQTDLTQLAAGMSGAILTGNIVGAAMNIISLFTAAEQPPIEQLVAELRQEMNERFDRIEAILNEIYDTILSGFDAVGRDVKSALQALASLELKLATLGKNLQESLQTLGRRPLLEAINGAIHYQETHNGSIMSPEKFGEYENVFHSWATIHARDELEQDADGRSYDDADLLDELSRPLEDNVMYLATFLTKRPGWNVPSFATSRLAHPTIWAVSSRAHAELRLEWPAYGKGITSTRRAGVKQAGEEFHAAVRRITVKADTSTGPLPNHELFNALNVNYKQKFTGLHGELKRVEENYLLSDFHERQNDQKLAVDFWGGSWQRIGFNPALPPDPPNTEQPYNIVSFIPAPYLIAEYIGFQGSKQLSLSYRSGLTNVSRMSQIFTGIPGDPFRQWWYLSGIPTVRVTVKYDDTGIVTRYVIGTRIEGIPSWLVGNLNPFTTYPWLEYHPQVLNGHWTQGQNLRTKFFTGDSWELEVDDEVWRARRLLLNQVSTQVSQELQKHQAQIYTRVINGLDGEDQAVLNAAKILGGAEALLKAFVELGMPRALGADDFLRGLLYGSQSLVDDKQVRERYAAALEALSSAPDSQRAEHKSAVRHQTGCRLAGGCPWRSAQRLPGADREAQACRVAAAGQDGAAQVESHRLYRQELRHHAAYG